MKKKRLLYILLFLSVTHCGFFNFTIRSSDDEPTLNIFCWLLHRVVLTLGLIYPLAPVTLTLRRYEVVPRMNWRGGTLFHVEEGCNFQGERDRKS
jgi:hypothetical protein